VIDLRASILRIQFIQGRITLITKAAVIASTDGTSTAAAPTGSSINIGRIVVACFVGSTLEFYDFLLYGTMAALVFNKLFFPDFSPFVGTLAAFATFAVGFVARPLGSVLFGYWGDKISRQKMLVLSLGLMGGASVCIGLLPDFSSIGLLAPIMLVFLRFIQGFALGGEFGGAALMLVENTLPGKRGLIAIRFTLAL
jgi:MFS family permease